MPKEDKLKDVRDLMERLGPVERRNFVLIAKAKEKYGIAGTKAASELLRSTPDKPEKEFWEDLDDYISLGDYLFIDPPPKSR